MNLEVLALTEDSGRDAHAIWQAIAPRMIGLIDHQIRVTVLEPAPELARAAQGHAWMGNQELLAHLARTIATSVLQKDTLVFFHLDGDQSWKARSKEQAKAPPKHQPVFAAYEKRLRNAVEQRLAAPRVGDARDSSRERRRLDPSKQRTTEEAKSCLVLVVPCWHIESWLYQNTATAIDLCNKHHRGRDVERFKKWAEQRDLLDDEPAPKKTVCLHDKHNFELAKGFPAQAVYDLKKSFHAAVETLRASAPLLERLGPKPE